MDTIARPPAPVLPPFTAQRLAAYLVLGAINPALLAAGAAFATTRATEIDRIEAALRLASDPSEACTPLRRYVRSVMREDAEAAWARIQNGGW